MPRDNDKNNDSSRGRRDRPSGGKGRSGAARGPEKKFAKRGFGGKGGGDKRAYTPRDGEKRPYTPRSEGFRKDGDRPRGDRPYSARPSRDGDRPRGDRPERKFGG